MKHKITKIALLAAGLVAATVTSQAALSLNFSNLEDTTIQFGAGSSFQLNPTAGSLATPQFEITSSLGGTGSANGLFGWINGNPWTIGAITTSGNLQTASVTGAAFLFLNDGAGNDLTGNLNWVTIHTFNSAGGINAALALNVTGLTYAGGNADLLTLAAGGTGSLNLTFQFSSGATLTDLTTGTSAQVTSYSGSLAVVPEPSTMIAGALLLLPFGATTLRILRKRKGLDLPVSH
jgi:hypothetical protein